MFKSRDTPSSRITDTECHSINYFTIRLEYFHFGFRHILINPLYFKHFNRSTTVEEFYSNIKIFKLRRLINRNKKEYRISHKFLRRRFILYYTQKKFHRWDPNLTRDHHHHLFLLGFRKGIFFWFL